MNTNSTADAQASVDIASNAVLVAKNISKQYSQGDLSVDVLKSLSLTINRGDRVGIIGSSGSGKSTLLHLLGGLDKPSEGEVYLAGKNLAKLSQRARGQLRNQHLGFVYQFHHLLPEFSALENVSMPLLIRKDSVKQANEKAAHLLSRVGLGERLRHKPSELSGGERQRAAIARALVTDPQVVLADEPTGNLDEGTADSVYELMLELNQESATSFLIVTHDSRLANRMDTVLTLTPRHADQLAVLFFKDNTGAPFSNGDEPPDTVKLGRTPTPQKRVAQKKLQKVFLAMLAMSPVAARIRS